MQNLKQSFEGQTNKFHSIREGKCVSKQSITEKHNYSQSRRISIKVYSQSQQQQFLINRRDSIVKGSSVLLGTQLLTKQDLPVQAAEQRQWELVDTPVEKDIVFLDIAFFPNDTQHGFLLGTKQTLLETTNGGVTWEQKEITELQEDEINYRFLSISLSQDGKEGWIVGKPAILLHTNDSGKTWNRKSLSKNLPGAPYEIYALNEPGNVEMVTDQGAIYKSTDEAAGWKSQVLETVDATLNRTSSSGISGASYYEGYFSQISRSPNGAYVAVSSRGNFYMTWQPGQANWSPHNRPAGRRVQSMGWTPDQNLWLTTKGGDVFYSEDKEKQEKFDQARIASRGFGILAIGYKDQNEAYACGGSGSLFTSLDGGKTYKRYKNTDNVPGNFYTVKFFGKNGFVLGNSGILLKYIA